jgi:CMP-N-acetylneuraminic acid synthetase
MKPRELKTLGVIPARGGSKRLPRKNVLDLNGAPLIAYTIEAAKNAAKLTDWLVSTDDEEIAQIAVSYGAPTPFTRPAALSGDETRNTEVMLHALDYMENSSTITYDVIVLLQPTCPIRDPEHINQAVELLRNSELSTVASVKGPFKKRHPNLKRIRGGVLEDYCRQPTGTDWEPFYIYNASIYAMRCDWLRCEKKFVADRQVPLVMDSYHSVDIDTEADLLIAEIFLRHLNIPIPQEVY